MTHVTTHHPNPLSPFPQNPSVGAPSSAAKHIVTCEPTSTSALLQLYSCSNPLLGPSTETPPYSTRSAMRNPLAAISILHAETPLLLRSVPFSFILEGMLLLLSREAQWSSKAIRGTSSSISLMALSLILKHIFVVSLLSLATSCCKAQQADSVQIVARAALCFDNRTVTNNCLRWMGRISNQNGIARQKSTNLFCNSPCYGQWILMLNCMDGILSNFQFYSQGMMQGVQAVFQMSCGGRANNAINTRNMIAEPIQDSAELFMPKHWASLWMLLLAFALVVALVLYISRRGLRCQDLQGLWPVEDALPGWRAL